MTEPTEPTETYFEQITKNTPASLADNDIIANPATPKRNRISNGMIAAIVVVSVLALLLVGAIVKLSSDLSSTEESLASTQATLTEAQDNLTTVTGERDKAQAATGVAEDEAARNKATAKEGLECIGTLAESGSNIIDDPVYALSVIQAGEAQCKRAIAALQALDAESSA